MPRPGLVLALLAVLSSSAVAAAAAAAARNPTRQLLRHNDGQTRDQQAKSQQLDAAAVAPVVPAAEGIDQDCVVQNCLQQAVNCLNDKDCKQATDILQACRGSTTLVQLNSQCNPTPQSYDPRKRVPPLLDQCVNIASYWYKDNGLFYNLTRCAQSSGCLTGISPKGCTPLKDSSGLTYKSSKADWEAVFDAMAASNKPWDYVMHAHFGWCLRGFRQRLFTVTNNRTGQKVRTVQFSVDANVSRRAFPVELKAMPGGKSHVAWSRRQAGFRWDADISSYRLEMYTAGVFESDPWLVLSPYPPFKQTGTPGAAQTPQAVLLLSAVNVGPVRLPRGNMARLMAQLLLLWVVRCLPRLTATGGSCME